MTMPNQNTIELHYDLFIENSHSMNALAFNRAQMYFIKAILSIGDFVDGSIKVNVEAKREGSIVDLLQIIIDNPAFQHAVEFLLGALVSNWFRPKIHKTEEIKNRLEIVEKIKKGKFTREEANYLIGSDRKLAKWCSEFYKSIQETREVSQITANILSNDRAIESETIGANDFDDKIITIEETTETTTIASTTIHIVSPVLIKVGKSKPWEGIYSGEKIEFKVEDADFLEQVYDHEIKFGNGTYITCSLSITTKTKIKDDGEIEIDRSYIVKDVMQWADDNTFQYYTKRYKRIRTARNAPKQLTLFDNEENQT